MLVAVTTEQFEKLYINSDYIVHLRPLEACGTEITLTTGTITVHETIEYFRMSC